MSNLSINGPLSVRLDRIGGTYTIGETVTGCVIVNYTTTSAFVSIEASILGSLSIQTTRGGVDSAQFIALGEVKPIIMLNIKIPLHHRGNILPAGIIELPFAFDITPSNKEIPLIETYIGVYIISSYTITAIASGIMGKVMSEPISISISVPGQGLPSSSILKEDNGVHFEMNEDSLKVMKNNSNLNPSFLLEGFFERYYNDIDIPLSGWIVVRRCSAKIISIELQLTRVEKAAIPGRTAQGITEVQNIQIAEGDVLRNLEIPIYMFFPRWYTSPSIKTTNMRVVFDINVIVLLEGHQLLSKTIPIYLYRAS